MHDIHVARLDADGAVYGQSGGPCSGPVVMRELKSIAERLASGSSSSPRWRRHTLSTSRGPVAADPITMCEHQLCNWVNHDRISQSESKVAFSLQRYVAVDGNTLPSTATYRRLTVVNRVSENAT